MSAAEATLFTVAQMALCVTGLGGDPSGVDQSSPTAFTELLILATEAPNVGGASTVTDPAAKDAWSIAFDEFCAAVVVALAVP